MLSFIDLTQESRNEILGMLSSEISHCDMEYAEEILDTLLDEDDVEYAISVSSDCLLIRAFDGIYSFPYPVSMTDDADPIEAARKIRAYAVNQEIPLVYTDVPCDEIGVLISTYRHANIDASDENCDCYSVRIMSEAALLEKLPSISIGDMTLDAITAEDDEKYARLCKDSDTNKHWGYDYSADMADPDDSYFREENESELARGVLVPFGVRIGGNFAGEAILYSFDLVGGCECAVRLFPEYRCGGYATKALMSLKSLAAEMGLVYLYATVAKENIASVRMCEKIFDSYEEKGETLRFFSKL